MHFFVIASLLVVLSALFGYVNLRVLKLPNTIGLMIVALLLFVPLLTSCTGQAPSDQSNDSKDPLVSGPQDSMPTVVRDTVVHAAHAPNRITRKIKQDREGNLLFASYDAIITYDGNSFSELTKAIGLEQCAAFDVLEDRKHLDRQ